MNELFQIESRVLDSGERGTRVSSQERCTRSRGPLKSKEEENSGGEREELIGGLPLKSGARGMVGKRVSKSRSPIPTRYGKSPGNQSGGNTRMSPCRASDPIGHQSCCKDGYFVQTAQPALG